MNDLNMNYIYQRCAHGKESTYGVLFDSAQNHQCFVIEDEPREVKVSGETRIPAGKYEIKQRKVLSGMTKTYREKYDWFDWHLELQDVPDFTFVYAHIGNYESNSDGCLLLNYNVSTKDGEFIGGNSMNAYKDWYLEASKLLNEGVNVFITVRDEDYLFEPF